MVKSMSLWQFDIHKLNLVSSNCQMPMLVVQVSGNWYVLHGSGLICFNFRFLSKQNILPSLIKNNITYLLTHSFTFLAKGGVGEGLKVHSLSGSF